VEVAVAALTQTAEMLEEQLVAVAQVGFFTVQILLSMLGLLTQLQ
jgi:hypothetical protein